MKYLIPVLAAVLLLGAGCQKPQISQEQNILLQNNLNESETLKEFTGRYYSCMYPSDWKIWDKEAETMGVTVTGYKEGEIVLSFAIIADNAEHGEVLKRNLEASLKLELSTVGNQIISRRPITAYRNLTGSGEEIVGGEQNKNTIILKSLHYTPNDSAKGQGGVTVSGYYKGLVNGKDFFSTEEKKQIDQFFESIKILNSDI